MNRIAYSQRKTYFFMRIRHLMENQPQPEKFPRRTRLLTSCESEGCKQSEQGQKKDPTQALPIASEEADTLSVMPRHLYSERSYTRDTFEERKTHWNSSGIDVGSQEAMNFARSTSFLPNFSHETHTQEEAHGRCKKSMCLPVKCNLTD